MAQTKEDSRKMYLRKYLTPEFRARMLLRAAKQRCKRNKHKLEITSHWIEERITAGFCEATGLPFVLGSGEGQQPYSPSLDRRDNSQGYTEANTQVVIWMYNLAKGRWDHEDILKMAEAICSTQ